MLAAAAATATTAAGAASAASEPGGIGDRTAARPFRVASVYYMASHHAKADELRPMWIWDGSGGGGGGGRAPRWRYELMAGSGVRQATTSSPPADRGEEEEVEEAFVYAPAAPRRHNYNFHQQQVLQQQR